MATVTLSDLWIHQVSDLSAFVQVYMGSLSEESGSDGEVRHYANGVTRAVTTATRTRTVSVELPFLARVDFELLQDWAGQPVMIRDPLGRKVFGVFFSVEASERPIGDVTMVLSAGFELSQLSLSEEV